MALEAEVRERSNFFSVGGGGKMLDSSGGLGPQSRDMLDCSWGLGGPAPYARGGSPLTQGEGPPSLVYMLDCSWGLGPEARGLGFRNLAQAYCHHVIRRRTSFEF